jgi:predicted lipoprotein
VANALNERVATGVLGGIDVSALARREVSFVGAVSTTATSPSPEIIPVQLRIVEGGR